MGENHHLTTEDGVDVRFAWVQMRSNQRCRRTARELISFMAEQIATATTDAVTVRTLSPDGQFLAPVTYQHPEILVREAMAKFMARTSQSATSGMWERVLADGGSAVRWHLQPGESPAEASPSQQNYLAQYSIRAVMAVPLLLEGRPIGGVSLMRFFADLPFDDADELFLTSCATRLAPALHMYNVATS